MEAEAIVCSVQSGNAAMDYLLDPLVEESRSWEEFWPPGTERRECGNKGMPV